MSIDKSFFDDVAVALALDNTAIIEKDYFVVDLLKQLANLSFDTHTLVFAGGTALAKSGIDTFRISEDVDIKIVPTADFHALTSNNARKKARKTLRDSIAAVILSSEWFDVEGKSLIRDEYRYQNYNIRYPQQYAQPPCLRPFIKLELIETTLYDEVEHRAISSLTAEAAGDLPEIQSMACTSIISTQAEKLVSMLRRTASHARNPQREDDPALIRHVYDTFYIQQAGKVAIEPLALLVSEVIMEDVRRYGNQHCEFVQDPIGELLFGLQLLAENPLYEQRFIQYILPMVYSIEAVTWTSAFTSFSQLTSQVFDKIKQYDKPT